MITFATAHQNFVIFLKKKGRANATVIAYSKDIEQLLEHAEKANKNLVHEIKLDDLESFIDGLRELKYTPKSISRKINSTKTFFKFLLAEGYIEEDPATNLSHPKVELKAPRILSKMEYRALRDVVRGDARTYAIVELLLQTGIRIAELAGIKTENIKFSETSTGSLHIPTQSSHTAREIPLNQTVQNAIQDYLKIRPKTKSSHLFVTKSGRPLLVRNIRATLDRYFKKAEVRNVKVNDLRNTFIAEHLKQGASLTFISKIVGHKRLSTTERYLQYIEGVEDRGKFELEEL